MTQLHNVAALGQGAATVTNREPAPISTEASRFIPREDITNRRWCTASAAQHTRKIKRRGTYAQDTSAVETNYP